MAKPVDLLFPEAYKRKANHQCPICGSKLISLVNFRDELSYKEFLISGMCQLCQDDVFDKPF